MATCKECLHVSVCSGFTPTDLDMDVWEFCVNGRTDEIPDIEERCSDFKTLAELIVYCQDCIIKKAVPHKDGTVWRCLHRTGDVKMEGYCESGARGNEDLGRS